MTEWPISKIRQTFINYFVDKQHHTFTPSTPVIPHDDPTLLFANAGMNQFKSILLGQVDPNSPLSKLKRAANSQKCIRAGGKHNDLEDAGKDTYHHTFFEMLGNWSFGDYFKREAIDFAMDLLLNVFKLDKSRLYVSYFSGDSSQGLSPDTETRDLWANYFERERILPFGMKDNFWEMGETGPCGPCTEIHYDFVGGRDASALVNRDSPEVVELWNLVFIQFDRLAGGALERLPKSHVDTGMGLERLACILQGKCSNYDTDAFEPIFEATRIATSFERSYGGQTGETEDAQVDTAFRVVADHMRSLCIAIGDGVLPDSVSRGYVLRRILRRAVRLGKVFTKDGNSPFLYKLVPTIADLFSGTFDEIKQKERFIQKTIKSEEENFLLTLEKGENHLGKIIRRLRKANPKDRVVSGRDAFFLYSSFGFPVDLTAQAAGEEGFSVDLDGFESEKAKEREISRIASASGKGKENGKDFDSASFLTANEVERVSEKSILPTECSMQYKVGIAACAEIVCIKRIGELELSRRDTSGHDVLGVILNQTSFYAESGGQIFDTGYIKSNLGGVKSVMVVTNVQKFAGYVLHVGYVEEGQFVVGDDVILEVDFERRLKIMPNHTMTHVLNHSIRNVLGEGIDQKGSRVLPKKLTFDFNSSALKINDVEKIEGMTKRSMEENQKVYIKAIPLEKAKQIRAIRAVFGETYPDPVRVVSIGKSIDEILEDPNEESLKNFSIELCGGTHLERTGDAKEFCIISESGIAKGIRRIVALTSEEALTAIKNGELALKQYAEAQKLDFSALSSFLAEDPRKNYVIPYLYTKKLDKIVSQLRTQMKAKYKLEQTNMEKEVLDAFRVELGKIDRSQKSPSNLNETKPSSSRPPALKSFHSVSEKTLVLFVAATATSKLMKNAIRIAREAEKGKNLMVIAFFVDKKGNRKFFVNCSVQGQKSAGANEWISRGLGEIGGKGNGNFGSAQGQAPAREDVMGVIERLRECGDSMCE